MRSAPACRAQSVPVRPGRPPPHAAPWCVCPSRWLRRAGNRSPGGRRRPRRPGCTGPSTATPNAGREPEPVGRRALAAGGRTNRTAPPGWLDARPAGRLPPAAFSWGRLGLSPSWGMPPRLRLCAAAELQARLLLCPVFSDRPALWPGRLQSPSAAAASAGYLAWPVPPGDPAG